MSEYDHSQQHIAFLLDKRPEDIEHESTRGSDCYGWRAAQIRSWSVPVASCIRCRRTERGTGGLICRHTTHRQCWPEAFGPNAECRCPAPYRCLPLPRASEDIGQ
jgi:hypothetical protein